MLWLRYLTFTYSIALRARAQAHPLNGLQAVRTVDVQRVDAGQVMRVCVCVCACVRHAHGKEMERMPPAIAS